MWDLLSEHVNLSYALAANRAAGSQCLKKENETVLVKKLIGEQTANGNWVNANIWQDHTLSTVFAVTALLEMGDLNDRLISQSIFYGVHYLMKTARLKNQFVNWPEDNFFTATAIARSLIMWRSKAYTNASIAAILLKVHSLWPQYKVKNYTSLSF